MSTFNNAWHRQIARAAKPRTSTAARTATPRLFTAPRAQAFARNVAKVALVLMFAVFVSQLTAMAQNLGTAPAFGQAVQGQTATTPEGTILNIVNWSCNVIAPVVGVACLGMAFWHFKSGRGHGAWTASGVGLMLISGLGRMVEGFITQAGAIR